MSAWNNEHLTGLLPLIISDRDPRPVKDQIEDRYAHGGGYRPLNGFKLKRPATSVLYLHYPGDPPFYEVARTQVRDELVVLFDSSFVAIIQPDGSFAVTRMD